MAFEHGLDEVGVDGRARSRQVAAATETRLVGRRPIASHVNQFETNGPFIWIKEKNICSHQRLSFQVHIMNVSVFTVNVSVFSFGSAVNICFHQQFVNVGVIHCQRLSSHRLSSHRHRLSFHQQFVNVSVFHCQRLSSHRQRLRMRYYTRRESRKRRDGKTIPIDGAKTKNLKKEGKNLFF